MAFTRIEALASPIAALDDRVTGQAEALKAYFDANPEQIKDALNALIDALCAADAAGQIGFAATGRIDAYNVQEAIEAIDTNVQSIVGGLIPNQSVTAERIQDGAVTGIKIADGAVEAGKIADGAVSAGKIANGAVEETKLSAAVREKLGGAANIADGSVTGAKLADGAVTLGKLADGAVTLGKLAEALRAMLARVPARITLADNTEYTVTGAAALNISFPAGAFECWLDVRTAAAGTVAITLPQSAQYACDMPEPEPGKRYEMSIKNGVVIAAEVIGA